MKLKANLCLNKLSRVGVGGWLEHLGMKLISTQVVVEVEVGVELGKISSSKTANNISAKSIENTKANQHNNRKKVQPHHD